MADEETKVYALNLFDIADREEYLAYSRRSAREVARHGGACWPWAGSGRAPQATSLPGRYSSSSSGSPGRRSRATARTPALADLHPHREAGTSAYVWHLFDRLDDLRPLLRADRIA